MKYKSIKLMILGLMLILFGSLYSWNGFEFIALVIGIILVIFGFIIKDD